MECERLSHCDAGCLAVLCNNLELKMNVFFIALSYVTINSIVIYFSTQLSVITRMGENLTLHLHIRESVKFASALIILGTFEFQILKRLEKARMSSPSGFSMYI